MFSPVLSYIISISISIIIVLSCILFFTNKRKQIGKKPLHIQPYNPFGPLSLITNPLDTARKIRKETKQDIFTVNSCVWGIGSKVTYVLGVENTKVIVKAKSDVLSFASAYKPFLLGAFGYGVLNEQTCPRQVGLLNKYLKVNYLPIYITASHILVNNLLDKLIPTTARGITTSSSLDSLPVPGNPSSSLSSSSSYSDMSIEVEEKKEYKVYDLQPILLALGFNVGVRNLLGEECLSFLKDFDYKGIFDAFELTSVLRGIISEYSPLKLRKETDFDRLVDKIIDTTNIPADVVPKNTFQDMIKEKHNPEGYTLGRRDVLKNQIKIFIFGSSFNGYNTLCYTFRKIINDPALLDKLKKEQTMLSGMPMGQEKLNKMRELKRILTIVLIENSFPSLLRKVLVDDFVVDEFHIPKGHIISYSPTLVHEDQKISNLSSDTELDDMAKMFELSFGAGEHLCPAKPYVMNSMLLIASNIIARCDILKKEELTNPPNKRMVTFPHQSAIEAYIR